MKSTVLKRRHVSNRSQIERLRIQLKRLREHVNHLEKRFNQSHATPAETFKAYQAEFSDRFVWVPYKENDPFPPFNGYIVKFLSNFRVAVRTYDTGEEHIIPQERLEHDSLRRRAKDYTPEWVYEQ